jgi:hypothetical protein
MQYPWPIVYSDAVLQEAIEIALGYLELTGQAFAYSEIQQVCAHYHLAVMARGHKAPY